MNRLTVFLLNHPILAVAYIICMAVLQFSLVWLAGNLWWPWCADLVTGIWGAICLAHMVYGIWAVWKSAAVGALYRDVF